MSEKLSVETHSFLVEKLDKYIEYTFQVKEAVMVDWIVTLLIMQVIAVEEKAGRSADYNRSPYQPFKTSKDKKVGLGMLGFIFII